nr:class I SAM-dependent methyltransferase [Streptomyces sp. YSPA8]
MMTGQLMRWQEDPGGDHVAAWRSENDARVPGRVVVVDDRTKADDAFRWACEGTGMVWRGDFHHARQLLKALTKRVDRKDPKVGDSLTETFHRYRQAQGRRARILGMLLVCVDAGHVLRLRRAPDVQAACEAVYGPGEGRYVVSLRELQGVLSAAEWRRRGVRLPALGDTIVPHYGVFSPVRGEYLDLVARAPIPSYGSAFDVGTGTGVLAAILARRGIEKVIATDQDERALACARENMDRLGLSDRVVVERTDMFPAGRAPLVVCNPPWLPVKPRTPLEYAVYDPGSRMLRSFVGSLNEHLDQNGEGWLIISDLAERLGLRGPTELPDLIERAGLRVVDRLDTRPVHSRARDRLDALHAARAAEVVSLWRLAGV